jgi:hypothetical protein
MAHKELFVSAVACKGPSRAGLIGYACIALHQERIICPTRAMGSPAYLDALAYLTASGGQLSGHSRSSIRNAQVTIRRCSLDDSKYLSIVELGSFACEAPKRGGEAALWVASAPAKPERRF